MQPAGIVGRAATMGRSTATEHPEGASRSPVVASPPLAVGHEQRAQEASADSGQNKTRRTPGWERRAL